MDKASTNAASAQDERKAGKLREFSAQLAARLQAAPGPAAAPARLAVRIGNAAYLLDLSCAGEIVTAPEVTPVPWTKPWFAGLANVRGRLVGVIDLLRLAGNAPIAAEDAQQLLVFNDHIKFNIGLLITRAFGLRNLGDLEDLGPVNDRTRPWEARAFRDGDGARLVELDLQGLISHEEFSSIGV